MLKVENIDIFGWEPAIRGMRNPLNSWDKSDSKYDISTEIPVLDEKGIPRLSPVTIRALDIGENDLSLMKRLCRSGSDHRKFMRMITVTMDITAPLYWWKEFDTYKVGTVADSCSTMHTITNKEFTIGDFSHDHLGRTSDFVDLKMQAPTIDLKPYYDPKEILLLTIRMLNACRDLYLKTKDKTYWWQIIQLLPSSYNQRRTVQFNYEVALNMYNARKDHKLDEWHVLCDEIKNLHLFKEITGIE